MIHRASSDQKTINTTLHQLRRPSQPSTNNLSTAPPTAFVGKSIRPPIKNQKNRDLFKWSCFCGDWLLIDQLHGTHGFKGFKGIANTLSTEAPTENVRKSGKVSPVCGKAEHTSIFGRRRRDFARETSY
jgi:hypothetical protein